MITYFSSHCTRCKVLKSLMDKEGIAYEEVDDAVIYMPIADENRILSMPFAEVDGKILDTKQLQIYITEGEK
mgnify:FL=1